MKIPDPKLMAADSGDEIYETLGELVAGYHDNLLDAQIGVVWILERRFKKGKANLGTCRIVNEFWNRLCGLDIVIEIDRQFWADADDNAQRYLLDHELCHADVKSDAKGEPVVDKTGRVSYVSLPHDVEEFAAPIQRWGMQSSDLHRFAEATSAQLSLEFGEVAPPRLRAVQ